MNQIEERTFSLEGARSGKKITGKMTFRPNSKAKPIIIFAHGFKGFMDWGHFPMLSAEMAKNGFVFIRFNFSMNGITESSPMEIEDEEAFGRNTFSDEMNDLGAVIDWVQKEAGGIVGQELNLDQLSLMGHSRGGGLVILKATEDPRVKATISLAGVHDFSTRYPPAMLQKWKQDGVLYVLNGRTGKNLPVYWETVEDFLASKDRFDIPNRIKTLSTPLLLFHGDQDETLAVSTAYTLASWKPDAKLIVMEGAGHTFGGKHPWTQENLPDYAQEIVNESTNFLKMHYEKPPTKHS
ncbi:alpha/beta hydrolase family protein [Peijinzhouia sedimentorum]